MKLLHSLREAVVALQGLYRLEGAGAGHCRRRSSGRRRFLWDAPRPLPRSTILVSGRSHCRLAIGLQYYTLVYRRFRASKFRRNAAVSVAPKHNLQQAAESANRRCLPAARLRPDGQNPGVCVIPPFQNATSSSCCGWCWSCQRRALSISPGQLFKSVWTVCRLRSRSIWAW